MRPQAILEIVGLLRDLVGHRNRLPFEMARPVEPQSVSVRQRKREAHLPRGVLEDRFPNLVREVDARLGVAALEEVDDPERLVVVLEPADLVRHRPGQRRLSVGAAQDLVQRGLTGVAEGGVSQIVAHGRRFREVLVLRDYQDLSYADIATALKIPRGTVMSRLHRARRLLQEEVRKHRSVTGEATDG